MSIRINNIVLDINEEKDVIKRKCAKKLRISEESIRNLKILREAVDARKKDSIKFNYTLEVEVDKEEALVKKLNDKDVKIEENKYTDEFSFGSKKLNLGQ